jgi:hypothetical protein
VAKCTRRRGEVEVVDDADEKADDSNGNGSMLVWWARKMIDSKRKKGRETSCVGENGY